MVLFFAVSTFVHIAVFAGVYVFYLDQSPLYFLDYIDRSFEIAQGYSQFMRSGDRLWSLIGYLVVVAAVFVGHAVSLRANGVPAPAADGRRWSGPDWRGLALASCVAPALFIAKKQRSEEHTSELQSLMRISYAVFFLKKKKYQQHTKKHRTPKHI